MFLSAARHHSCFQVHAPRFVRHLRDEGLVRTEVHLLTERELLGAEHATQDSWNEVLKEALHAEVRLHFGSQPTKVETEAWTSG